jgi:hypothetical protein
MPDVRQPASYQEVLIDQGQVDALPKDLPAIVKCAAMAEIIRRAVAPASPRRVIRDRARGTRQQQSPGRCVGIPPRALHPARPTP